jgi:hypothetical protein
MISLPPSDCTDWLTTGERCKLVSVEEAGDYLAATIASMVILSCGLRYPGPVSTLRVTCIATKQSSSVDENASFTVLIKLQEVMRCVRGLKRDENK